MAAPGSSGSGHYCCHLVAGQGLWGAAVEERAHPHYRSLLAITIECEYRGTAPTEAAGSSKATSPGQPTRADASGSGRRSTLRPETTRGRHPTPDPGKRPPPGPTHGPLPYGNAGVSATVRSHPAGPPRG